MVVYTGFRWYDYAIFGATLVISLAIGIYYAMTGDKHGTTKEFLVGNRRLGVFPVSLSLYVSHVSAVLILGATAEVYQWGITQWFEVFGMIIAHVFAAVAFVPLFYDLAYTSAFMYLEARFDKRLVRLMGSGLTIIYTIVYCGLAMFAPAIALEGVTGISMWISIVFLGVTCTIYCAIGGIRAVIGTDMFQGIVMIGGVLLVLILGSIRVGGLAVAWEDAYQAKRIYMNLNPAPFVRKSIWSAFIGKIFYETGHAGLSQASVQRIVSTDSRKHARDIFLWNIPILLVMHTMVYLCGVVVFSYYDQLGCDPLRTGQITNPNQLLPFFIMDGLRIPGIPGLFVAVLFCAALSTVSSGLTTLTAITWKDFLEWKFFYVSERNKTTINKMLVLLYGVISMISAFLFVFGQGNVLQMAYTILGPIAGPITGLFLSGMFFPCSEWKGLTVGFIVGLAFTGALCVGSSVNYPWGKSLPTDVSGCAALNLTVIAGNGYNKVGVWPLFTMAYGWYFMIAIILTLLVGVSVSILFFPQDPRKQDPKLLVPFFDRVLCCLPASWRRPLWCSVPYDEMKKKQKKEEEAKANERPTLSRMDTLYDFENPAGIMDHVIEEINLETVPEPLPDHTYL